MDEFNPRRLHNPNKFLNINHHFAPSLTNQQISAQVGVTFSSHPMRKKIAAEDMSTVNISWRQKRSRPVGYAAEYLTLASIHLHMCISPLMFSRVLYHIFRRACCTTLHLFPYYISQQRNHPHTTNHAIQSKVCLAQRRQHPPANEQPAHQCIQTPPVCGNNVEEDAAIRCHFSR